MPKPKIPFMDDYVSRLTDMTKDCRHDMHNPMEQNLRTELYHGMGFDSEVMRAPRDPKKFGAPADTDTGFWLVNDVTGQREWFNLAGLIACFRRLSES